MSRRAQENILAIMLMAFFVGVLVISLDYSPRARLVPIPISVLGILLLGAQLVWQNLRSPDELHVDMLEFLTKRTRFPKMLRSPTTRRRPGKTKAQVTSI